VVSACGFAEIQATYDIIINGTAASLSAELPPIRHRYLRRRAGAGHDVRRPAHRILQFAAQHGAQLRDGLGMLVEQAAEAFSLWRGVQPATADVLEGAAQL
jgi:shikimate dehydrogenase